MTVPDIALLALLMLMVTIGSSLVTGWVRRYAIRGGLIDHPNERSAHATPTPRGGGLSIVIAVMMCIVVLLWMDRLPVALGTAMLAGGLLIALVGWLDDHRHVSVLWRGGFYLLACAAGVYFMGGIAEVDVGGFSIATGLVGNMVIIIALCWLVNLYNFMDGADGLAATQAITASLFAGLLFWSCSQSGLAIICFVMAAACSGFLYWNWPPARIFMGDAGSCFLGFMFGMLALAGEQTDSIPAPVWIILLAVFIWDATLTLIRRFMMGEKWYAPHRTFAFHRLMLMGVAHSTLTLWVLALNIIILWPLAWYAYAMPSVSLYVWMAGAALMIIIWLTVQWTYSRRVD